MFWPRHLQPQRSRNTYLHLLSVLLSIGLFRHLLHSPLRLFGYGFSFVFFLSLSLSPSTWELNHPFLTQATVSAHRRELPLLALVIKATLALIVPVKIRKHSKL
jgi:hypothetical protein